MSSSNRRRCREGFTKNLGDSSFGTTFWTQPSTFALFIKCFHLPNWRISLDGFAAWCMEHIYLVC